MKKAVVLRLLRDSKEFESHLICQDVMDAEKVLSDIDAYFQLREMESHTVSFVVVGLISKTDMKLIRLAFKGN